MDALEAGLVLTHPFVVGELACGSLRGRDRLLRELDALPGATEATHDEVLRLVERHRLFGRGVGWIDAHLLASALLSGADLYSLDAALTDAWGRLR